MIKLAVSNKRVAWSDGHNVYIGPKNNAFDIDGNPMGVRWECSIGHWNRYRALGLWPEFRCPNDRHAIKGRKQ